MANPRNLISPAILAELLSYNPQTGAFRNILTGNAVGYTHSTGYKRLLVLRKTLSAHRVAWALFYGEWPAGDIDHADGDRGNNRIANLRQATMSQNIANAKKPSLNTSGYKGVWFDKRRGRWTAQIRVNYKRFYLGLFDTPEEAHAAYCDAAKEQFGVFARTE